MKPVGNRRLNLWIFLVFKCLLKLGAYGPTHLPNKVEIFGMHWSLSNAEYRK